MDGDKMQQTPCSQRILLPLDTPESIDFMTLSLYYEYLRFVSLNFLNAVVQPFRHSGVFDEKSHFAI